MLTVTARPSPDFPSLYKNISILPQKNSSILIGEVTIFGGENPPFLLT
jgi:hypothetical protein